MTHGDPPLTDPTLALRRTLQSLAADFNEVLADVLAGMVKASSPLFASHIHSALAEAWSQKWSELSRSLARSISERLNETIEAIPWQEYGEAFWVAGWPLAPSFPLKLMQEVQSLYQAGRSAEATTVILSCYHRNDFERLTHMVENWATRPLMAPRMPIVRDALEAHRQQKYTLSVPALLPQIEGVLMDYFVSQGLEEQEKKALRAIAAKYQRAVGERRSSESIILQTLAETLLRALEALYTPTKSQRVDFWEELEKPPDARRLNRHTVLHGVAIRYNTAEYSLKVFLFFLDTLSFLLSA